MRLANVAGAVAAMVVAGCCAVAGIAQAEPGPPPGPPGPPPGPTGTPPGPAGNPPGPAGAPPGPKTVIDHDGSYTVGTDILPGTYRSAGPVGDSACYWKRLNGDKIVDNALTKKPQLVTIEPTDTVFKTNRCQSWQKTECPPECPTTQPPPDLPGDLRDFLGHPPQPPPPGGR
jgi:hypothetical protein